MLDRQIGLGMKRVNARVQFQVKWGRLLLWMVLTTPVIVGKWQCSVNK